MPYKAVFCRDLRQTSRPTLYVGNLPAEWMEDDLRAVFENFNVTRIALRHDKQCAFLDLASEEDLMVCALGE